MSEPSWPGAGGWGRPAGQWPPADAGAPPSSYPPYPAQSPLPAYGHYGHYGQYGPQAGAYRPFGPQPYKGARFNLPPSGPGSLASQWSRLGARVLDGFIFLPVFLLCEAPAFIYFFANVNMFMTTGGQQESLTPQQALRFDGIFFGCFLLVLLLEVTWEAYATRRWGRTPGKAIVHIRPMRVREDQRGVTTMSRGACWGRAATYFAFGIVSLLVLIDELWCLWDGERQCLHDKVARTVVISDT